MNRKLLRHTNVVVDVRASGQLSDFDMRAINHFVADTTNASLTTFDSG